MFEILWKLNRDHVRRSFRRGVDGVLNSVGFCWVGWSGGLSVQGSRSPDRLGLCYIAKVPEVYRAYRVYRKKFMMPLR